MGEGDGVLLLVQKYIRDEHGKAVLWVDLLRALYGTMIAALLFWKMLSSKLVSWRFEISPYDWCVPPKNVINRGNNVHSHGMLMI